MKKIAIVCKHGKVAEQIAHHLIKDLVNRDCSVSLSDTGNLSDEKVVLKKEENLFDEAELVIVLGGDGTMIHTAHLLNGRDIPVLGVNLGTLGFLTEVSLDEMKKAIDRVLAGEYSITRRCMLRATLHRGEMEVISRVVLNDAVINKGALARILRLEAYTKHGMMTSYRADGLIISTPTGSTAYNMAAGGPVLYPTMDALIMTPICPHTFANRPVVLPDSEELLIELIEANGEVYLTLDGQEGVQMLEGDRLEVSKAHITLSLIESPSSDYFHILRHKLGWGQS